MARSGQRTLDLRARRAFRPPITSAVAPLSPLALPIPTVDHARLEFVSDAGMKLSAEITLSGACPYVDLRDYQYAWEPDGEGMESTWLHKFTEYVCRQDENGEPVTIHVRYTLTLEEGARLAGWLREMNEKAQAEFNQRLNVGRTGKPNLVLYHLDDDRIWLATAEWGSDKLRPLGIMPRPEFIEACTPKTSPLGNPVRPVVCGEEIDWNTRRQICDWLGGRVPIGSDS